jgi:single-stranded DNA-binding protein
MTQLIAVGNLGKQAENVAEWLHEGHQVQVDGRLELRKDTAQDGAERTSTNIVADGFLNLTSREERGDAQNAQHSAPVAAGVTSTRPDARPVSPAADGDWPADLDDVPFD